MSKFLGVGKVLAVLFWGLTLINLVEPLVQPFALLLQLAGALILLIHGLELWLFDQRIRRCSRPGLERAQVMLFGIFHALALPVGQALECPAGEEQLEAEHA